MTTRFRPILMTVGLAVVAACGRAGAEAERQPLDPSPVPYAGALELRRVWSGDAPNFYPSNPSPDGRLMSEIDWSTGDLAVIDMTSGTMRRVTDKGPWNVSGDYAEFSAFSPDGRRLAYSWFSSEAGGYQVRTINLDGSDMRIIFPRRTEVAYVAVEDWSRDGASILVTVFRTDRTTQIGVISVADATYRALKTNDWRPPSVLVFSPNSRYIAYDIARATERSESDIFVMAADGSHETMAVGGSGDHRLLGWLPDGSGLLYHERSPDARALLAVSVREGQPAGRPQLVRPDMMQLIPLGFSRDAYFYGVDIERPRVHMVGVDLSGGRLVGQPSALGDAAEGSSHDASWSPDGQSVAYLVGAPGGARLAIRSLTGELRQQIAVPLSQARNARWAPDGSAVLLYGTDPEGRVGIHRVDLRTGALAPLLAGGPGGEAEGRAFWAISPDGQTIYHRRPGALGESHMVPAGSQKPVHTGHTIVAHDVATGESRVVAEVPTGRVISVSPDGTWLAYTAHSSDLMQFSVYVVPTSGGPGRQVFRQQGGTTLGNRGGLEWTPDGQSILFYYAPENGPSGVWQIPVEGGAPRLLIDDRLFGPAKEREFREPRNFRLSRDGRQIIYETGRPRGEIWMMRGFIAAAGGQ